MKQGFASDLNHEKTHGVKDIVTAFIAGVNQSKVQVRDLLYALKQVKTMMDSEDYSLECDKLYDLVAATIQKYDNQ